MSYPPKWKNVSCFDWCEDETRMWLCLSDKNAICEINKMNRAVKILGHYPNNGIEDKQLSLTVKKIDNYIVFSPFAADDIAIYDTYEEKLTFINIPPISDDYSGKYRRNEKFYRMFVYERDVFFFGLTYPGILRLNLDTKEIYCFNDWVTETDKRACRESVRITDGHAWYKGNLYLPLGNCNGVLKINPQTMEWNYLELDVPFWGILGMTQRDSVVWLTDHGQSACYFAKWDMETGEIEKIDLPTKDAFYAPVTFKNSLIFYSNFGKKSYCYNIFLGKCYDITQNLTGCGKITAIKKINEDICFYTTQGDGLYRWHSNTRDGDSTLHDTITEQYYIEDIPFLEETWNVFSQKEMEKAALNGITEGEFMLQSFIETLLKRDKDDN